MSWRAAECAACRFFSAWSAVVTAGARGADSVWKANRTSTWLIEMLHGLLDPIVKAHG